jgi:hypothetical protein
MKRPSPADLENAAIARRLRILRYYITGNESGSRQRFAARVGIEYKRWNNFERGLPFNRDVAIHLVRAVPGLTLDWLYLGREDGLPIKLQRELAEAGKAVTLAEPPPPPSSGRPGSHRKPVTKSRA